MFDVLVVGAGVVGVTAALSLQQRGMSVMLVDQQSVAQGCSFGNAGIFSPTAFPLSAHYGLADLPAALLNPSSPAAIHWPSAPQLLNWGLHYAKATGSESVRRDTALLHRLCRDGIHAYELLLGSDLPSVSRRGYLLAHLSSSEVAGSTQSNSIRASHGTAIRMLSAEEVNDMEPALKGVASGATLVEEAVHVANPAAFVTRLAEVFLERGGIMRCDRIHRLEEQTNGSVIVRSSRENYAARNVAIATGAGANKLLANCGHRLPLIAERGYHLELDVERGFISRPTVLSSLGTALTPSERGARIAGVSHFGLPGFEARPALLLSALDRVRRLLPNLRPRLDCKVWSGERPATPDSLPIIEQVPGSRSIFVTTGHGHAGLTLGAVTARVLADLVTGSSSEFASALSSRRFD